MGYWKAAILSAGQGKRMKTERPKVFHFLLDRPILFYIIDVAKRVVEDNYYLIVSPKIYDILYENFKEKLVLQEEPLGTGDAVKRLMPILEDYYGNILILPGDVPLIREESLKRLCEVHEEQKNSCTLITTFIENPMGYGRIVRDKEGRIVKIVEEKDADENEKNIKEINTSIYAFSWEKLKEVLPLISNNNAQREFYLTDVISIFFKRNEKIGSIIVDSWEVLGINTQKELYDLNNILKAKINQEWMDKGVSFLDSETSFIGKDAFLDSDVLIYPNSFILGKSYIGKKSFISHNVFLENYYIGESVEIGPFSYISNKLKNKGD